MHAITVTGTQWDTLGQLLFLSLCLTASADADKSLGHWDSGTPYRGVPVPVARACLPCGLFWCVDR